MKLRAADPFAALVDFMAFMVLISVFMFIISESSVPNTEGSKANVISFRVTTKSARNLTPALYVDIVEGTPQSDIEYSLWWVDDSEKAKLAGKVLRKIVVRNAGVQSSAFGVAPDDEPKALLLSFSHLENMDLIGTFVEMAIDVQFGKKSCSIDWSGRLGIDAGILIDFSSCSAS